MNERGNSRRARQRRHANRNAAMQRRLDADTARGQVGTNPNERGRHAPWLYKDEPQPDA